MVNILALLSIYIFMEGLHTLANIIVIQILDHVVLFDPFSFAVKTVSRVYSLFHSILVLVVKYKI